MRGLSLWRGVVLDVGTVIENVVFEGDGAGQRLVVHVRPMARERDRCGRCRRRCPRYDAGARRRRWRSLDHGTTMAFLEADAPRVACPQHGVVVAHVPWARHGAGHTRGFDQQVAWLATRCSKSAVTELMRIAWRTVGAIISRVWAETDAAGDQLAGLRRIGIDEISYKRGHKYLIVVVDHDTGRLVWAAPGRDRATVRAFFDDLEGSGPGRCAQITHVSADGADWIASVVADRCPTAIRCIDPFHVVSWATQALDVVRRQIWNAARKEQPRRRRGRVMRATGHPRALKQARYALWKNPENLTTAQRAKLDWIAKTEPQMHRAYLLKEGLRLVFQLPYPEAIIALDRWISWARRSRIKAFVDLQRTITIQRAAILAAIENNLSNGRIESVNTKIRLITRMAFGFASPHALIALAMLSLGGHPPTLPGRA